MSDRCAIYNGDCLEVLRTLPSESVHCAITSPPYWGLRDYKIGGQIGLEESPDAWVSRLVEVFRELRRVIRKDGTFWVNCGDAYASGKMKTDFGRDLNWSNEQSSEPPQGYKHKDLLGLPWLLAFALRADGWYLRSAITLCKQNPMPESVTDRPTSATEMMFLFAKRERYFYDADAVRQAAVYGRREQGSFRSGSQNGDGHRSVEGFVRGGDPSTGRNLWNWWPSVSEPSSNEHYAAFPSAWVKPCILAGTSEKGCCPNCGAQWVRVVEEREKIGGWNTGRGDQFTASINRDCLQSRRAPQTLNWKPSCACDYPDADPCTILDPFCGSGTTGLVALRYNRNFIGIELNPDYVAMAERRLAAVEAQEVLVF